jgi:hypothetical protein
MGTDPVTLPYLHDARTNDFMPLLPLRFVGDGGEVEALALIDSGSPVNLLPRSLGDKVGLRWQDAPYIGALGGAFPESEARAARVQVRLAQFPALTLRFAWLVNDLAPCILGQYDFFMRFTVRFRRAEQQFDLWLSR